MLRRLNSSLIRVVANRLQPQRCKITYRSGAVKPMPHQTRFGLLAITAAVVPGLLVGAAISKNMASFLEENDLFVPSEDDEDD